MFEEFLWLRKREREGKGEGGEKRERRGEGFCVLSLTLFFLALALSFFLFARRGSRGVGGGVVGGSGESLALLFSTATTTVFQFSFEDPSFSSCVCGLTGSATVLKERDCFHRGVVFLGVCFCVSGCDSVQFVGVGVWVFALCTGCACVFVGICNARGAWVWGFVL